jgi:hypothetical protein
MSQQRRMIELARVVRLASHVILYAVWILICICGLTNWILCSYRHRCQLCNAIPLLLDLRRTPILLLLFTSSKYSIEGRHQFIMPIEKQLTLFPNWIGKTKFCCSASPLLLRRHAHGVKNAGDALWTMVWLNAHRYDGTLCYSTLDSLCALGFPSCELTSSDTKVYLEAPLCSPLPYKRWLFRVVCSKDCMQTTVEWVLLYKKKYVDHHRLVNRGMEGEKMKVVHQDGNKLSSVFLYPKKL